MSVVRIPHRSRTRLPKAPERLAERVYIGDIAEGPR